MTTKEQDTLEAFVDAHGLYETLNALARVCTLKADHIETNWQDASTAEWWNQRGVALDKLSAKPFMQDA